MKIKATDNPSLAFICFVERFVLALLSVYDRMPDFSNMRANNDNMRKTPLVRYSWGIKETKTNIKHKTNSEFAIRSPKIIGLLILIYSSKFDNKSLVKISKFDMIKIKRHRNALLNNGKALIRERFVL